MTPQSLTALDSHEIPQGPQIVTARSSEAIPLEDCVFDDLAGMVAAHEMRVFRFLLVSLRDRDMAQTLTQETFLRAWSARASFRGDCAPATWLMRIAVNLVRDQTRTGRFRFWKKVAQDAVDVAEVSAWLPGHGASAETSLMMRQQVEQIWETVATLSGRQRTVFLLRFLEELELNEISEATGMPLSTIKSHLYRAITTVRVRHAAMHQDSRGTR